VGGEDVGRRNDGVAVGSAAAIVRDAAEIHKAGRSGGYSIHCLGADVRSYTRARSLAHVLMRVRQS
jgi:hypothetical protein